MNIGVKLIALVFTSILIFIGCHPNEKMRVVELSSNLPLINPVDGQVANMADTISIVYAGDDVLYSFRTISQRFFNNTLIGESSIPAYFLMRRQGSVGSYYDTLNAVPVIKGVDTFLNKRAFHQQQLLDLKNTKLVETKNNLQGFDRVEAYLTTDKPDESYPDSMIVYYKTSLEGLLYSLSSEVEKNKKMRVAKIQAIFNPRLYTGYPGTVGRREFRFELNEQVNFDTDSLSRLLQLLRAKRLD